MHLRAPKISKFPGGACPQIPLGRGAYAQQFRKSRTSWSDHFKSACYGRAITTLRALQLPIWCITKLRTPKLI